LKNKNITEPKQNKTKQKQKQKQNKKQTQKFPFDVEKTFSWLQIGPRKDLEILHNT
jgi:hypothetical protein